MEIQIVRDHAPMWHFNFSEDRGKGSRIKMNKRDFKRLQKANRVFAKAQKEIQELLSASRI